MKPIKVSDVRDFVYCPRAWIYRQRGVKPLLHDEERLVVEQRLEDGRQFHQDHGEAVFQAVRERPQNRGPQCRNCAYRKNCEAANQIPASANFH